MLFKPDIGSGDPGLVDFLNSNLQRHSDFTVPNNYSKYIDYEFSFENSLPSTLQIVSSYKDSLEVLDGILFTALGIHTIATVTAVSRVIRVKGTTKATPFPPKLQISNDLKYRISLLNEPNYNGIFECGKVMEDILKSVEKGNIDSHLYFYRAKQITDHSETKAKWEKHQNNVKNRFRILKEDREKQLKELAAKQQLEQEQLDKQLQKLQETKKNKLKENKEKINSWRKGKTELERQKLREKESQRTQDALKKKQATESVKKTTQKLQSYLHHLSTTSKQKQQLKDSPKQRFQHYQPQDHLYKALFTKYSSNNTIDPSAIQRLLSDYSLTSQFSQGELKVVIPSTPLTFPAFKSLFQLMLVSSHKSLEELLVN